jgi:hypothetical protein
MAGSNTSEVPPSAFGTWPTTSPDRSSRPADSDDGYTLKCDEPLYSAGRASRTSAQAKVIFAGPGASIHAAECPEQALLQWWFFLSVQTQLAYNYLGCAHESRCASTLTVRVRCCIFDARSPAIRA